MLHIALDTMSLDDDQDWRAKPGQRKIIRKLSISSTGVVMTNSAFERCDQTHFTNRENCDP